jgi:histidine triad (HIT) family protein
MEKIINDDCIFCKLANGVIPTNTVFEDEDYRVILDAAPANLGHCLVLPKTHAENVFELDEKWVSGAHALAKRVALAVKKATNCDGINILQNNGTAAEQSVMHYHVHIIPRLESDDVTIKFGSFKTDDPASILQSIKESM